jgi:hypothetical protein
MSINLFLDSSKTNQRSNDFEIKFNPAVPLNGQWECALVNLNTWNSFFNIATYLNNNTFTYSIDSGVNWTTLIIPNGNYSVQDLNDEIQRQMKGLTHWDSTNQVYYISLIPNTSTLKVRVEITNPTYQVDFTTATNFRTLIGFNSAIITATQEGPNNADITGSVNALYLHCDVIGGSYDNSAISDVLYSFVPRVRTGANIDIEPNERVYFPVKNSVQIENIRIYLTDQLNRSVDLNGENLSVRLHFRKIR